MMTSFKNAKRKENSFGKMSKKKNYGELGENDDVIELSSGSDDEDVVVIKEERIKSEMTNGEQDESVPVSSESDLSNSNFDININIKSYDSDGNVSDVNTGVKVKWKKVVSPKGWTNKMKKYYNKPCTEQRYFDWKKILSKIQRGSFAEWWVSHKDIVPFRTPFKLKKCLICRQTDHLASKCPKKYGNCSMCGVPGHQHYRCPLSMCLNCGVRKNSYVDYCSNCDYWKKIKCKSCKRYGHKTRNCTDQWRRFHSTIDNKEISSFETTLNKNLQCCNCAKPGHLFEDCKEQYFSGYMPNSSLVGDYTEIKEEIDLESDEIECKTGKSGKRPLVNNFTDSEYETIGKKYMKLDNNRAHSQRERSLFTFLGIPSASLTKNKKTKKRKKKKRKSDMKSFLEEN